VSTEFNKHFASKKALENVVMLFSTYLTKDVFYQTLQLCLVLFLLRALGYVIYYRFFHPYTHYPGPVLASITSIWYFRAVRYGRGEDFQLAIHKKYGPFVRISPDQIQIMDPAAIETIYGPKNVFKKSEFYEGFNAHIAERRAGFEEQDERLHMIRRRIIAPLYSQASILEFEPCVDRLISIFYHKMEHFAEPGAQFDMSVWLWKYTSNVIGEMFYGRSGGFGRFRLSD
jgi:hypothetical protein